MRFIFLLSLAMFFSLSVNAEETITFSGGAKFDTYQPATIIPLLKEAFKRNGYKFEAKYFPSRRSLIMSNGGHTDGELHRIYDFHNVSSNQYPNLVRIESKLMSVYLAVFSTKQLDVKSVDDFQGLLIGYQSGRKNVASLLRSRYSEDTIFAVPTDERAFEMLARGRVDIVIAEHFQSQVIFSKHTKMSAIQEVLVIDETPIYAYIHKRHGSLTNKIADTLDVMKADGTFAKIRTNVEANFMRQNNP